jgi:hypothetical protein
MAKNKNMVSISGNFGRDPIMSKTGDGTSVMNITIANHKTRDKDKEPVWIKLAIWGKYAESLEEHVQSGRKAWITGTLRGAECYLTQAGKDSLLQILKNANSYGENMKQLFIDITKCFTAVPVVDVDDLEFGGYDKKDRGETAETKAAPDASPDLASIAASVANLAGAVQELQKGTAEATAEPFSK